MVTLGELAIWSFSRSNNRTRMPCPDGFDWSTGSAVNFQWYEALKEIDQNIM